MSQLIEKIDQLFKSKGLPLVLQEASDGSHIYNGVFQYNPEKPLPFSIVIQPNAEVADFQIVFNELAYVTDYSKKNEVLNTLNEINLYKTGYYRALLGGDGEIFVKTISRVASENIMPLYEILVIGSQMAMAILEDLNKVLNA